MKADRALDALGNGVRRRILLLLEESPRSVGDLASHLPISRPAVSKHLRVLEQAELVRHEPEGTKNIFYLDARGFEGVRGWLDRFWDEALSRFQLVAENTEEED